MGQPLWIRTIEWLLENRVQTKIEHNGIIATWEVELFDWRARGRVDHPLVSVMGKTFEGAFGAALQFISQGKYGRWHVECPDPKNNRQWTDYGNLGPEYSWPEASTPKDNP